MVGKSYILNVSHSSPELLLPIFLKSFLKPEAHETALAGAGGTISIVLPSRTLHDFMATLLEGKLESRDISPTQIHGEFLVVMVLRKDAPGIGPCHIAN